MNNAKNSEKTATHYCKCCKCELPLEAFYMNKQHLCPDHYCKECRKKVSRKQHKSKKITQIVGSDRSYPVITKTEDPEKKMQLILHALGVVRASIEQKQKKEWEKDNFN